MIAPVGEELAHRLLGRRNPQAEIATVPRPVDLIDRRLQCGAEAPHDLTGIALFEKREVGVDLVEFAAQRGLGPLTRPGEILVDFPRCQPPRRGAVVLADLNNRLGQAVQRSRCQPRRIAGPLVLRQRVDEETLLVLCRQPRLPAPLEGNDVGQPGLDRRSGSVQLRRRGRRRTDQRQYTTFGIQHEPAHYSDHSQIPRVPTKIPHESVTAGSVPAACLNAGSLRQPGRDEPARTPIDSRDPSGRKSRVRDVARPK
jgi:hypothetical protein